MSDPDSLEHNLTPWALVVELALVVAAMVVGGLFGFSPLRTIELQRQAIPELVAAVGVGLLAAVPLCLGLVVLDRWPWGPFRELHEFVERRVVPLFAGVHRSDMMLIALAAGLGEETLFRGLIQDGLQQGLGGAVGIGIGLTASSLFFGLAHWLTPAYAVLATAIGVYLGIEFLWTGHLLAPIVTHAAYDLVALLYLTRRRPA